LLTIANDSAWSFIYTIASIGLSHVLARLFRLPQWVAPASTFNNTSSLPLLLLQSLDSVGSLRLILRGDETTADAIERAQSYFLVCAVVSKTIAYVVGPRMLHDGENAEDHLASTEEQHQPACEDERLTETTSLLPQRAQNAKQAVGRRVRSWTKWLVSVFPHRVREELMAPFEHPFAGVAICCTLVGALLGLVPALHRAFFFRDEDGGYLQAWLTTSVRNIGRLFTTLQIFLVGCKLGVTFERMMAGSEAGGDSSRIPIRAMTTIFVVRLVAWPAVSIPLIYGLAKHTKLLGDDPILWFSMMLMPAGPPALVISGLAEVAQASETEKMAIAKTLTVRITPKKESYTC
jgi:predicted permease